VPTKLVEDVVNVKTGVLELLTAETYVGALPLSHTDAVVV
jgi:hypothetical protein